MLLTVSIHLSIFTILFTELNIKLPTDTIKIYVTEPYAGYNFLTNRYNLNVTL